jgi:hypothetical protein
MSLSTGLCFLASRLELEVDSKKKKKKKKEKKERKKERKKKGKETFLPEQNDNPEKSG